MNEIKKQEVFSTLNRITEVINNSPLLQDLAHLVNIKTSVVGGAIRDLYLDKPIKDIDIAISLDFNHALKVEYPKNQQRSSNYYCKEEMDDDLDREYWGRASAEAEALKSRNYHIIKKLEEPQYFMIHEFMEKNQKDLSAIDAITILIRKIIDSHQDYSVTQVFDKTTLDILVDKPKLNDIPYQNMGLCGVVSLKDKNTDYPIELLFTTDVPLFFIKCFDFNLCKIYMENENGEAVIKPSDEFIKDCENKTITYTPPPDVDEKKLNKSLFVRYERFQKKFPEFILISDVRNVIEDMKLLINKAMETVTLKYELQATDAILPEKNIRKANKL
jgi:hypothetical protein